MVTRAEPWIDADAAPATIQSVGQRMAEGLAKLRVLKPFPQVVQKLVAMIESPDFEVAKISRAVEEDPALASNVLRVANSMLFGGLMPSKTISQALVRVGIHNLYEMVVSVAVSGMFKDAHGVGKKIRDHCAGVGAVVRALARVFLPQEVDGVFLSGLMHDLGKLLLMQIEGESYGALTQCQVSLDFDQSCESERALLGFDHATFGGFVVAAWKIPEPAPRMVAWHHRPAHAFRDPSVARQVALLRIADEMEPGLTAEKGEIKDLVFRVSQSDSARLVGIEEEALLGLAEELVVAKSQALALFGL
ncbi:MAG TPA: HDOD domain-containing protein [Anaeromyxobacteraceae bacterium]|nr:HDOD domain-containing protein [Anaeromyxobacteraceae bacterium]